jgi:hypothetical protein
MRRRDFIAGIAGSAAALPFAAPAQQPAIPVVGFMHAGAAPAHTHVVAALRLSSNGGPAHWLSVRLYFSIAIATSWWRWQHATSCRRFTRRVNTLWTAA